MDEGDVASNYVRFRVAYIDEAHFKPNELESCAVVRHFATLDLRLKLQPLFVTVSHRFVQIHGAPRKQPFWLFHEPKDGRMELMHPEHSVASHFIHHDDDIVFCVLAADNPTLPDPFLCFGFDFDYDDSGSDDVDWPRVSDLVHPDATSTADPDPAADSEPGTGNEAAPEPDVTAAHVLNCAASTLAPENNSFPVDETNNRVSPCGIAFGEHLERAPILDSGACGHVCTDKDRVNHCASRTCADCVASPVVSLPSQVWGIPRT